MGFAGLHPTGAASVDKLWGSAREGAFAVMHPGLSYPWRVCEHGTGWAAEHSRTQSAAGKDL